MDRVDSEGKMNLLKLKFLSVIFAVIIVCFSILSLYNNKNIWLSVFLLVAYIICNGTLPKAHLKLRYRIVFYYFGNRNGSYAE